MIDVNWNPTARYARVIQEANDIFTNNYEFCLGQSEHLTRWRTTPIFEEMVDQYFYFFLIQMALETMRGHIECSIKTCTIPPLQKITTKKLTEITTSIEQLMETRIIQNPPSTSPSTSPEEHKRVVNLYCKYKETQESVKDALKIYNIFQSEILSLLRMRDCFSALHKKYKKTLPPMKRALESLALKKEKKSTAQKVASFAYNYSLGLVQSKQPSLVDQAIQQRWITYNAIIKKMPIQNSTIEARLQTYQDTMKRRSTQMNLS